MSEALQRANLPAGQSLPITQDNAPRRGPGGTPRRKARKPGDPPPGPAPDEALAPHDAQDAQDSGHIDLLL